MSASATIAENRLSAALAAGAFDGLAGHGQPLRLDDDSAVPPEWRLAYRLLRANGFAPAWIEAARAIRRDLARARADLQSVAPGHPDRAEAETRYERCALVLNRRIAEANLACPSARWHLLPIDVENDRATIGA